MFNKINKAILSKFFIVLMIVSLFNPVIFAQEVNSTPKSLDDIVIKETNPIYDSIDLFYNEGLLSEENYRISQKQDLTRYEVGLLLSNPLGSFMSSENYEDFDLGIVREINYFLNNFQISLKALGFEDEMVNNLQAMTKEVIKANTKTEPKKEQSGKSFVANPDNLSRSKIAEIQYILGQVGLYNGEIDGLYGNMTKGAIERYQKEVGLGVNGALSESLHSNLVNNLDTPEDLTNLANNKLQKRAEERQAQQSQEKSDTMIAEVQPKDTQNEPKGKRNLANNVEIHGSTQINYHKTDASGDVPLDEDDDPIYEEEDTFEQVFNLDIVGYITDKVKIVANLKAENEDGLLSEGGELELEDVQLVGIQDDINKFVIGSQPGVDFGALSYRSKGDNGFSWQHNGEDYSLYTLYAIKDHTFDDDGEEVPLPYKKNTIGVRVATEKFFDNIKLGFNILNTKDDKKNSDFSGVASVPKTSVTVASITGDYDNKEDLTIGAEIAVMDKDSNTDVSSSDTEETAYAVLFDIAKQFTETFSAKLHLRKVQEEYNTEKLVDEKSFEQDNYDSRDFDDIDSPYNPGETGGTLDLAYAEGNFSSDLTLEYWDGKTEDSNTEKGVLGSAQYAKDNWSVNYDLEHWKDDGDGFKYEDHTLTGNYRHEFTKTEKDSEGNEVEKQFATVSVEDSINLKEAEEDEWPEILTNRFTIATEITPMEDMSVKIDYTNEINDNEENKVDNNNANFAINKKFKVTDKFSATPYYRASYENGKYDNPKTEDTYDPYEVESIVQNVGVDTQTVIIPEELRVLASLSYNDFDVTKGKLDEDGYYISGNEPRTGFEATAGINWTPKTIEKLQGLDLTVSGGKKVYDYEHKDSDKDQDSWTYSVGVNYNRDISDYGNVGVFYNRTEDIDDIEEYETTTEEYGVNGSLNIGENTAINASISESNSIDKSQDKDLTVVNNTIGITTRPVGADGPSINLNFTQEEYHDKLDTEDNYKIREVKGTVGGSF